MPRGSYAGISCFLAVMENSGWPYFVPSLKDPSASSLPKPFLYAVASTRAIRASSLPNLSSCPTSSFPMAPVSYSSIAAAIVLPIVMVSSPSSLQMKFALFTTSMLSMPQSGPNDHTVSYSGPSPSPAYLPSLHATLPHPKEQKAHALFLCILVAASDSPPTLSAVSKCDSRKFLVGREPTELRMFTRTFVPKAGSPPLVTAFSLSSFLLALTAARNLSLSPILTPLVPLTTIALRFLEPITAPTPLRPAALWSSFMMLAKRTLFSPAGPIHATLASGSCFARRAAVVSGTFLPQRSDASHSSAVPL
ncbi:hypothetical protein SDC9_141421 [bioreactor metagenome]|uniref:Uncharacterized protein n=1 Tax=bioreactor metagenome TaxID=1076179 RepID=A0A645DY87_9ZZZZ